MTRPSQPDRDAPEGFVWRPVVDDEWTTRPDVVRDRRCRWPAGGHTTHGAPAAAVLFRRGRRLVPYGYCAEHLYGRWIEAGAVMGWRLRPVTL